MADKRGDGLLIKTLWIALMIISAGGCATLGKDECLNADWRSIGYEDGARGYRASRIGNHRKACAKHGVTPDFNQYELGRQQGLEKEWCTPQNGYRLGSLGRIYNGVCPQPVAGKFIKAFDYGKMVHAYQKEVDKQEAEIRQLTADYEAVGRNLEATAAEMVSDKASPKHRRSLLREMRRMEADQQMLISDISEMEIDAADMRAHLHSLKAAAPEGVASSFNQNEAVRPQTLKEKWCTPQNGYRLGMRGGIYKGICPRSMERKFLKAYSRGKAVYGYERQISRQTAGLKKMTADYDAANRKLEAMEAEMVSNKVSERRRKSLLNDMRRIEADQRMRLADISDMKNTVADMRRRLNKLKAATHY